MHIVDPRQTYVGPAVALDAGALRTVINSVYPLAQTTEALARSRRQRARGKIISPCAGESRSPARGR